MDADRDAEQARRAAPKKVTPLVANGIRYEACLRGHLRGFKQPGGVIVAINEKTGEEVWALQVYTVQYDAAEEQDVQDVFITAISISGGKLKVVDERDRRYLVNLATQKIERLK